VSAITDDTLRDGLVSAMSCALSYVAAVARDRLNDDHGVSLDTATRHARALGATAAQVTTSLRVGAEGDE
jgi:hypothetical protein